MKIGDRVSRLTKGLLLFLILSAPAMALAEVKPSETKAIKEWESEYSQKQNNLIEAARLYQDKPSAATYDNLWQQLTTLVEQATARHHDPAYALRSLKVLSQAGLKIIDVAGGSARIYTFNPVKQGNIAQMNNGIDSKDLLLQWTDQEISPISKWSSRSKQVKSRWSSRKPKTVTAIKTQSISVPGSMELREAALLPNVNAVGTQRYLLICGTNLQTGNNWLMSLKRSGSSWLNYPNLFQEIPSFLFEDGRARIRPSGNNLAITLTEAGQTNNTAAYELIMPFVEDHFALTSKEAQDSASAVAKQFLLALQCKRSDMTKVWLADPKLSSIPGYLGLYNNRNNNSLRLINMSPPLSGGSRFRLITNTKDDLIVDVGKFKGQWLIKALYIAPSDRLAKDMARFLPAGQTASNMSKNIQTATD